MGHGTLKSALERKHAICKKNDRAPSRKIKVKQRTSREEKEKEAKEKPQEKNPWVNKQFYVNIEIEIERKLEKNHFLCL